MNPAGFCYLANATIARECGVKSSRTVQRAVRELQRLGLLSVRVGGGRSNTNAYNGLVPAAIGALLDAQRKGVTRDTVSSQKGWHGDPETVSAESRKGGSGDTRSSYRSSFKGDGPRPDYYDPFCTTCREGHPLGQCKGLRAIEEEA
jgi:hypothetical protein